MFKQGHLASWQKWTASSLNKFYGRMWDGFCLKIGECFLVEVLFQTQKEDLRFLYKTVLGNFELTLCLRDVMLQSLEILHIFNTLTLK